MVDVNLGSPGKLLCPDHPAAFRAFEFDVLALRIRFWAVFDRRGIEERGMRHLDEAVFLAVGNGGFGGFGSHIVVG